MNNKIWFGKKTYGWGWTPCTWQGWFLTLAYVIIVVAVPIIFPRNFPERELAHWAFLTMTTLGFLAICFKKGEKPAWTWGKKP